MFWRVLLVEESKILKRALLWVELAVLGAMALTVPLVGYAVGSGQDMAQFAWPGGLVQALDTAGQFGGLLLIILVGAAVGQEYRWRTVHMQLARGIARPTLLTAKFTAMLLPALLVVLVSLLVGGAVTGVLTYQVNGELSVARIPLLEIGLGIVRTAYVLLPYAALAFLLAIASRSTAMAVGFGVGFVLLGETLLVQLLSLAGGTIAQLANFLPAMLGASVLSLNQAAAGGPAQGEAAAMPQMLDPLSAAAGIALYTIVFVGLALWLFRRQDLTD